LIKKGVQMKLKHRFALFIFILSPLLNAALIVYGLFIFMKGPDSIPFWFHEKWNERYKEDYYTPQSDPAFVLMHRLIEKDYPAFGDKRTSEWERVNILREWVFRNADGGIDSTVMLDQRPDFDFYGASVPAIVAEFIQDQYGVWCGGSADVLKRWYQAYGFVAFTVNMGSAETMITHMVTLVRIQDGGRAKTVIEDSYLNSTYVWKNGDPCDYFELLAALKEGKGTSIRTSGSRHYRRDFLVPLKKEEAVRGLWLFHDVKNPRPVSRTPSGLIKYKVRPTPELMVHTNPTLINFLKQHGNPLEVKYLFLYPIDIYGDPAVTNELKRRVNALLGTRMSVNDSIETIPKPEEPKPEEIIPVNIEKRFKKAVVIFKKTGNDLFSTIQRICYGKSKPESILVKSRTKMIYTPRDERDHLATNFFEIPPASGKERWLRLRVPRSEEPYSALSCTLAVQNDSFTVLLGVPYVEKDDASRGKEPKQWFIRLPEKTNKVRVRITAPVNQQTEIPSTVILEQAVF
jgi:hypothetical protein